MHYAWHRKHWACSSAPAQSKPACKSVVGQRLKLSGMRWTEHGATGILTLRCLEASDRWEEILAAIRDQTEAA